ncbi:MAG TPA: hypothetical protein VGK73_09960 [Polyangiaceae bacterium]
MGLGFVAVSDDDYARIVIAQRFAELPRLDPSGTSWLPLPFWIYGSAFALFGPGLGVARGVAVLLGVQAALCVWLAARWLGAGRAGALASGLLAAAFPWSVWLGAAPLPEVATAGWLALGAATLASETPRRRVIGAFAIAAACFCRYEAWPIATVFAFFTLSDARRLRDRSLLGSALVSLGPILAWLLHGVVQHGDALFFWKRVAGYRQALGGSAPLVERLVSIPAALVRDEPGVVLLLALLALAFGSWQRWRRLLVAALALVVFLMLGELGGGGPTHHAARALLPVWYLACVLAGDALGRRLERSRSPGSAAIAPAAALAVSWFLHGALPRDLPDRRSALAIGTKARELAAPALLIDTPDYSHLAITAAFGRPQAAVPLDTHDPRTARPADVFASETALRATLRAHPQRWLVVSRAHADPSRRVGRVRAENDEYLLVEPGP